MKAATGQLVLDGDVASVTEFIEREIPADRRLYVAERLPEVARIIWAKSRCALLEIGPNRDSLPNASESDLAPEYAGDGSGAAKDED